MSLANAPAWLAELQARISTALRTPLDRSGGTLEAVHESYDASLCAELVGSSGSERERLAIYNRQYWFRLLTALHSDFRLTARLLGYWDFNEYAARFFETHPPRSYDLHDAAEGFELFLQHAVPSEGVSVDRGALRLPRQAVLEAACIDSAHRRVFNATSEPRLVLSASDAERLPGSRLVASKAFVIVEEHWPLLALRRTLQHEADGPRVALPTPHVEPLSWAVFRAERGTQVMALTRPKARLLTLLGTHTVADALSHFEAELREGERHALPSQVQLWLAEGMKLGFWTALQSSPVDADERDQK